MQRIFLVTVVTVMMVFLVDMAQAGQTDTDKNKATHIPMPLVEAVTALKEAHAEMAKRNSAGEYYLALAIDPGDTKTRSPARYWIFDYGPETGCHWIAYPRSLPGAYFKLEGMVVNGHYPETYLSENGDLISLRTSKDSFESPSRVILVAYGSTTLIGELFDDSGKKIEFKLSPGKVKTNKEPAQNRYKYGGQFVLVLYTEKVDLAAIHEDFLRLFIPRVEKLKSKYKELDEFPKEQRPGEFLLSEIVLYPTYGAHPKRREGPGKILIRTYETKFYTVAPPLRMVIMDIQEKDHLSPFQVPEISFDCRTNNLELEKELFTVAKECFILLGGQLPIRKPHIIRGHAIIREFPIERTNSAWSEVVNGLRCRITTTKNEYNLGEPIIVELQLCNTTENEMIIYDGCPLVTTSFDIRDGKGKAAAEYRGFVPSIDWVCPFLLPGTTAKYKIKYPGRFVFTRSFDLFKDYEIASPGTYAIKAIFNVRGQEAVVPTYKKLRDILIKSGVQIWKGELHSNTIVIKVLN